MNIQDDATRLDAYQEAAKETDIKKERTTSSLAFLLLGLNGEVGSLLSALKKNLRETVSHDAYRLELVEEFGDTLWYFSAIATHLSLSLSSFLAHPEPDPEGAARTIDAAAVSLQGSDDRRLTEIESFPFEVALIRLGADVGLFLDFFYNNMLYPAGELYRDKLQQIFSTLFTAMRLSDVSLAEITSENLKKTRSMWIKDRSKAPSLDPIRSVDSFPREFAISLQERKLEKETIVIPRCNGVIVGSELSDWKLVEYYRYHDVFHLAYAAILGWSPAVRYLLKLKRRGVSGRHEDGAKAVFLEEAISALVYQRAQGLKLYEGVNEVEYTLLKQIKHIVKGYEVEECPYWLWQEAILEGFKVFRAVKDKANVLISVNLDARSISWSELSIDSEWREFI